MVTQPYRRERFQFGLSDAVPDGRISLQLHRLGYYQVYLGVARAGRFRFPVRLRLYVLLDALLGSHAYASDPRQTLASIRVALVLFKHN